MHAIKKNRVLSLALFGAGLLLNSAYDPAWSQSKERTLERTGEMMRGSKDYQHTIERFLSGKLAKVVGGKPAAVGAHPWQVSLTVSWIADAHRGHFCGGSIYDANWIITAAHCVAGNQPQDINIVAGSNVLSEQSDRVNIKRIIMHDQYADSTSDNDMALLELWKPLKLSDRIKPVELIGASDEESVVSQRQKVTVTGWGATKEGEAPVKDLRFVDVPIVARDRCNRADSYDGMITENMLCAGEALGERDSCQGDSGGPLVTKELAGSPRLIGVVSWGEGCGRTNKFGVYARVSRYLDWIKTCTTGVGSC